MSLIKVVKKLGGQKQYGVEFSQDIDEKSVARILNATNGQVEGFANMSSTTDKKVLYVNPKQYDTEPLIPINQESVRIIISGEAGSGKSTMSAMFLNQYEQMYPDNQMFLVSQKDKAVDRNLSKIEDLYQFTDEDMAEFDINNFQNCIFLIDDSDYGKNSKKVFELLNQVSTVGREYGVGYIFVTHFNSRLNATSVYKEFQYYITFKDNLANNRMLETHMGFSKKQIDSFKNIHASFFLFNKIFNCLVSDIGVQKY